MNKRIVVIASFLGMLAVILGAFGAHGLRDKITTTDLANWKTAVDYQFYHVLTLLFLSQVYKIGNQLITISFYAFTAGIILFSGSLYLLSTRSLLGLNASFLGPVTPVGGLLLIIGWISLFLATVKINNA